MTDLAFLSAAELRELTGLRMPSAQRRWLIANGYVFDVRADGTNAVMVDAVRLRHGLAVAGAARPTGPDLAALRRMV